jgi:hypothetical protein
MKNILNDFVSTAVSFKRLSKNKTGLGNLYVAYRNNDMIEWCGIETNSGNEYENGTSNYKASVFSTTGGSYYINGVPTILSQDDEAMLYQAELTEYY